MTLSEIELPTPQDVERAKESSRTLSQYAEADRVRLSIKASNGKEDEFILPGGVMQALMDILIEISNGNAFSVIPIHAELTTQEAANILNVSRPHLVKLLEEGTLPFRKIGVHRRVRVQDLVEYKNEFERKRKETLAELAAFSQKIGMYEE